MISQTPIYLIKNQNAQNYLTIQAGKVISSWRTLKFLSKSQDLYKQHIYRKYIFANISSGLTQRCSYMDNKVDQHTFLPQSAKKMP